MESAITILFTSPLPVALVILGVVYIGLAIIGKIPSIHIDGCRAVALGVFGIVLIGVAILSAWLVASVSIAQPEPTSVTVVSPEPTMVDTATPTEATVVSIPTITPVPPTDTSTPEPLTSTPTPMPAPINATVKASVLNMREGPGTEYTIVGKLQQGDVVTVTGQNSGGDWLEVEYEGQIGWVAKEYVEVPAEVAMVPIAEVPSPPTGTPSPEPTTPPAAPVPSQMPSPTTPRSEPAPAHPPIPKPTDIPTPTPTPPVVESRMVALQTYHTKEDKNRYVTAMGADWDWVIRAETTELKDFEKFTILCLDNGKVAFMTFHGRYVTAMGDDGDWVLRAETSSRLAFEEFTLIEADTGKQKPCLEVFELFGQGSVRIALKTHHGKFVTAMNDQPGWDWELRAETQNLGDWEKFTLVPLP